jgi:putative DNA primase/helicase
MTVLKNVEAALPGAASKAENSYEFRNKDIPSTYSNKAKSSFHCDLTYEEQGLKYNAVLITPAPGAENALFALRRELKQCGCRYSCHVPKGWVCALRTMGLAKDLLDSKHIKVSFKELYDPFFEKSKTGQIAVETWDKIVSLEEKVQKMDMAHLVEERSFEDEIIKHNLAESDPIVLKKREQFSQKQAERAQAREKIDQLRNSAKILDEKETEAIGNELPDGYYFHPIDDSLMYQPDTKKGQESSPSPLRLCRKIEVIAVTRNDSGKDFERLLEFRDDDGVKKTWILPMELLAGNGDEYRRMLFNIGLDVPLGKNERQRLSIYLQSCKSKNRVRCVPFTGWYKNCFVMPEEVFGSCEMEKVILKVSSQVNPSCNESGTLQHWKDEVASLCRGNSRLLFALSVSLAGPLLYLLGAEPGGFHFCGLTSQGKTTAQIVAASVWGGKNYLQSWRNTINGLEGVAAHHNDGLLVLDEIAQCDPREVGECAYLLANGIGKGRASKEGTAKERASWRLLFLSSGEVGLAHHMASVGKKMKGGQEVRLLEISADADRYGMFETIHGFENGKVFAENLKEKALKYHGTAGKAFLSALVKKLDTIVQVGKALMKDFIVQNLPEGCDSLVGRALNRFALIGVAGEIGVQFGIFPFEKDECLVAAEVCFKSWLEARGGIGSYDERAIISQVKEFFETNGGSRFSPWKSDPEEDKTVNRAGYKKMTDGEVEYYVLPSSFNTEVCRGFDASYVAKVCVKAGLLHLGQDGGFTTVVRLPGSKTTRCYVFSSRVLGGIE